MGTHVLLVAPSCPKRTINDIRPMISVRVHRIATTLCEGLTSSYVAVITLLPNDRFISNPSLDGMSKDLFEEARGEDLHDGLVAF